MTGRPATRVNRRAFLAAAAAPLAAGLGGCSKADAGRVLVVGGGLCGLVTLDRLVKAGRDAMLLEAAPRLGGRILTVRTGLSAGLRGEMGAERVGTEDHGVRGVLRDLGIKTVGYPKSEQPFVLEWKGRGYRFQNSRDLPEEVLAGLSDRERRAAPAWIFHTLIEGAAAPDDAMSGIEWLRSIGMTPKGEELVRAFVPLPLDRMSAAVLHRAAVRDSKAVRSDAIEGGTDRIVEALAERHAGAIAKDVLVESVAQAGGSVTLSGAHGRRFEGAHAVICLPLTPLRALKFEGGVPEPLARRLQALDVAHEVRTAREDLARDSADYVFGERRVSWRLPEISATGSLIRQTLLWEPDVERRATAPGASTGSLSHDFSRDPLIGAAYAFARSGSTPQGIVRAGRLIFAGADLSDAPGWMEGAVRSAEQAFAALQA